MGLIAMGQGPMVFESILIPYANGQWGYGLICYSTNAENWVQFEPQGMQPNLTCYEE